MRIELYLPNKIMSFTLPKEISGSFSFDENPEEESKLINIEARDNEWILYSTQDTKVINGNNIIKDIVIRPNSFYIIRRMEKNYLIYTSDLFDNTLATYTYNQNLNLIIGNTNQTNCIYRCEYINNLLIQIHLLNGQIILENNNNNIIYINDKVLTNQKHFIRTGDKLNIYGLKIRFLPNLLIINNPGNRLTINEQNASIQTYFLAPGEPPKNIEFKDEELYKKDDYFQKSPRIRRIIETKKIKLSPPPKPEGNQELPLLLTIGPMLTMGVMSIVTVIDTMNKLRTGKTTMEESWPQLITSGVMLISMLLWPLLTKFYNDRMQKTRRKEVVKKYGKYLEEKKQELTNESKLQKEILIENLITVESCLNIIQNRNMNFWDKRIDQNDFLIVRIGVGNELLDVKVEYPEEGFTIEEDELRKKADEMVEEFKYIENVPIGYSLYDNKVTAIMGNLVKGVNFVNNIILQLVTFYSYEDLKLVVFTNEKNEKNWEYIKYLNHNFTNSKNFRFFSSTIDSSKMVAEVLNAEVNNREEFADGERKSPFKPYYLIIIDDYDRVKRYEFIKKVTETDNNLGFSLLIIEDRLSKLPSKCNNFISLGEKKSGVLKNSYERQEQIAFSDEINYTVNMMEVAKKTSNVPIEFENGLQQLPDAITFLEMEKVGKVEQLNILNRWNTNDSTQSLKAEVGVDEQGDLMYLDLHEKFHGPHGLIAGMTGSGKSEFIITYILSMAINYSPDDIAFILIDYKGGGLAFAFENKTSGIVLPHLAGTITNLDKAEMDRTLVSIDSEIKRRQQIFNTARDNLGESTIDIYKYQKYFKEGKLKEPVPHLFIICDEFAELKSQQPEFMENLISVARIGRSLGVHLILATQKPSGVVNDQIWSNTKFRVCLKVQDESDSKEMLKRPEAASLKQTGRFYLQVGFDEYFALGQSGWCGAKYYPSDKITKQVDKSINFIDDCGRFIKSIQAGTNKNVESQGEQLAAIMNSIIDVSNKVGKKARKLWLDNIPNIILEENIKNKYNVTATPYNVEAVIGEYDAPERQEQGIVKYNFTEDGNTTIYGLDGSEREMLLEAIIYSAAKEHTAEEINFYIIDYGSESLRKFEKLPQVGGIVFTGEDEKYNNLLKLIKEELQKRKKLFVNYGGEYKNYIKNSKEKLPVKVIIFNNYDSIYEANEDLYDDLPELVRDSERYGIIYIFTTSSINSIHSKVQQSLSNIYSFQLKDPSDYQEAFGVRTKTTPRDIEGRGLFKMDGVHEFQTVRITSDEERINDFILDFVNNQKEINTTEAEKIPQLPEQIKLDNVNEKISTIKNVPIGIKKKDLEIATLDLTNSLGSIITSNKLGNTEKFIKSLLTILRNMQNTILIVVDPMKLLNLDKNIYKNYYDDAIEEKNEKVIEYINKLKDENSEINGVILIYGFNKFISKITDSSKIEELFTALKDYEKISLLAVDDVSKFGNYSYEAWFSQNFDVNNGIWIGRGIQDQNLLHLSTITKEMTKNYKNNMGYLVEEGLADLCKLLDFETKEETSDEDER